MLRLRLQHAAASDTQVSCLNRLSSHRRTSKRTCIAAKQRKDLEWEAWRSESALEEQASASQSWIADDLDPINLSSEQEEAETWDEDDLKDFDWRAELRKIEEENRNAQVHLADSQLPASGPESNEGSRSENWQEKAFLVGVSSLAEQRASGYSLNESLNELERLANSAGLQVVGRLKQQVDVSPKTYLGSGKLDDLQEAIQNEAVDTVIFDDELHPGQARALEKALGSKISLCDRTALILDIFSQRAASREGKTQVELAQCEYQLPRLTRMWTHLERQAGGRVKGMGEKQIEIDKRLLRARMAHLRRSLNETRRQRRQTRDKRAEASIPVLALCGYTNAGKSTILNTLSEADVIVRDALFATLDPTTRRIELPTGREVLVTDTVGFIQKLPTQLVAAFRATLEEIAEAQLLIHVVDVSHPNASAHSATVIQVLEELGADRLPLITVWNKVDACAQPEKVKEIANKRRNTVAISAKTGQGMEEFLELIEKQLSKQLKEIHCLVPYAQGDILNDLHRQGTIRHQDFSAKGTLVAASVPISLANRIQHLTIDATHFKEKTTEFYTKR